MKNKILIALVICLVLVLAGVIYIKTIPMINGKIKDTENLNKYQGPIPEGYDEAYFRETGITRPLNNS